MLYGSPPSRRRDALRNRAAIVQAASDLMTGIRSGPPMPEIARRAGVGQATIYRHFPDRRALAEAVVTYQVDRLEIVAATVDHPAAFRALLLEVLRRQVAMRSLVPLALKLDQGSRNRLQHRVIAALTGPLRRAQACGHVRADLAPADLALLFAMVHGATEAGGLAAERSVDLLLDGVFCSPA